MTATNATTEPGPTKGAAEDASWRASPTKAFLVRVGVALAPLIAAFIAVRFAGPHLLRPDGGAGTALWIVQAGVLGALASSAVDRYTRQLLPLATLLNMSLVFPDRAPSRFGVALRAGTVKQLRKKASTGAPLAASAPEAAERAIELITALSRHDRLTRGHTERVRAYADLIAEEMDLPEADRQRLTWGVLLHDIGKVTVPPEILNKNGRPTDEEWAILRQHPEAGARMLEPLRPWLGEWLDAAGQHHERWDGKGYPYGLAGNEISLSGRIAAVADAYDVITSKRSYKQAMTPESARQELVRCAGTQFDPAVVRAMLNVSIGRRWTLGPLAWVLDSPVFTTTANTATAPVTVASVSAAVAASAAVTGVVVPQALPEPSAPAPIEAFADDRSLLPSFDGLDETGRPVVTLDAQRPQVDNGELAGVAEMAVESENVQSASGQSAAASSVPSTLLPPSATTTSTTPSTATDGTSDTTTTTSPSVGSTTTTPTTTTTTTTPTAPTTNRPTTVSTTTPGTTTPVTTKPRTTTTTRLTDGNTTVTTTVVVTTNRNSGGTGVGVKVGGDSDDDSLLDVNVGSSGGGGNTDAEPPIDGALRYRSSWYLEIGPGLSWVEAYRISAELGGHLVTVNSAGERDFLHANFDDRSGLWLGAWSDDSARPRWITDEPYHTKATEQVSRNSVAFLPHTGDVPWWLPLTTHQWGDGSTSSGTGMDATTVVEWTDGISQAPSDPNQLDVALDPTGSISWSSGDWYDFDSASWFDVDD